ncbi:leucine-rich repeat domain-containing protein [Pseudomonas fluorescens]|uniref:Leucine-rich repeat domain-containing protein n=1 Tax=Pseudomonas fluorescens TaxID=294 RepID=A0A5E6RGQ1_PSEFL|nr:leucine-rich repeat domain-containing protein [Pseudomonas fluorescens]VVM67519.1 hypothetical protein PS655_01639 [Pseudomonas fluorescens]
MPVKPPRGGGTHVDVPGSPGRSVDVDTSLPGPSGRRGVDSGITLDNPQSRAGATDTDVTHPAPAVVVQTIPVETRLPTPQPALDHYVINARAILPEVNSEGLTVFKKRTYAEVADGEFVLVAVDPETGLHRAKLPGELLPSGPVLLRDTDSGIWRLREDVTSTNRAQVKKYFPEATDQHADDFIDRFDDSDAAEAELKRIQVGFLQLDRDLSVWERKFKHVDHYGVERLQPVWRKLRRLYKWQGEPEERVYHEGRLVGFKIEIDLTIWPIHQYLSTRFSSIVSLTLRGEIPLNPKVFLAQFPNIEILTAASQMRLGPGMGLNRQITYVRPSIGPDIVEQLTKLPRLRELDLQDCNFQPGFSLAGMTELQILKLVNARGMSDLTTVVNEMPDRARLQVLDLHQNAFLRVAPDVTGMYALRVLNLSQTGINQAPVGLGTENGPSRLEVLKLGGNSLSIVPSLKGMTALQELDLSSTVADKFPEGITSEIPGKILNLANNHIASIPESVEIRAGFNLMGNPVSDPASLRRLIHARIKTGTDSWLGEESLDRSAYLWLRNVPPKELSEKLSLWDSFGDSERHVMTGIRKLSGTPEFHVEYPLLQRRVWWFLEVYVKADASEKARLTDILINEPSPGKMLDRLEAEIRAYDSGRQNQPLHHLPKRPKLD